MLSLKHPHPLILAAVTLPLLLIPGMGCQTGETSMARPEPAAETRVFTAEEVAALRAAHDLDSRLLALPGVVSVGIAGSSDDAWIQVLCEDDSLAVQAQEALGATVNGVPIRFDVTEGMRALPPDSSRQQ